MEIVPYQIPIRIADIALDTPEIRPYPRLTFRLSKLKEDAMRIILAAVSIFAFASLSALPLSAQETERPGKACKADREKFCADVKASGGNTGACMKQHEAELTPECASARHAAQEANKNLRQACKADSEKFCAAVGKGHGAIRKCLESHATELQEACGTALKAGAKQG